MASADFMRRIRDGDDQAARELVPLYEPVIRREARLRLRDQRLASRFECTDICQSVLASFFVRAAAGQFDLDKPDRLLRLLVVMTRNKLTQPVHRHRADRRHCRWLEARDPADLEGQWAAVPSPSSVVADRELLEEFRCQPSAEERLLAELRAQGCDWAEIAGVALYDAASAGRRGDCVTRDSGNECHLINTSQYNISTC
jgi:RNA polymerase sigma-70 factor (ECF subfamily)